MMTEGEELLMWALRIRIEKAALPPAAAKLKSGESRDRKTTASSFKFQEWLRDRDYVNDRT